MESLTQTFKVPPLCTPDFADQIAKHDLPCELMGVTRKSNIIYDVTYEPNQEKIIDKIYNMIQDFKDEQREKEEEQ